MNTLAPVPFLFTSEKELLKSGNKWYAMWINPETMGLSFKPNFSQVFTKKGYGFFHWKARRPELKLAGVTGWLYAQQVGEEIKGVLNRSKTNLQSAIKQSLFGKLDREKKWYENFELLTSGLETPQTALDNNPYLFINRMQRVALQDKYYIDQQGVRRENIKYLYIFTKRYPEGRKVSGFFSSFQIPEKSEDSQMIYYSADFTVVSGLDEIVNEDLSLVEMFKFDYRAQFQKILGIEKK